MIIDILSSMLLCLCFVGPIAVIIALYDSEDEDKKEVENDR